MMTRQEEDYLHFVTCLDNLNRARRILRDLKQSKDCPLVGPAFEFALIEYSKPFLESRGTIQSSHKLGIKHVPLKYRKLHNEIIAARKQVHAHSDLTLYDAKIYVATSDHGRWVGIAKNIIDNTEKLAKIDDIIDLIEQSLDSMYEKAKKLKAALPINT